MALRKRDTSKKREEIMDAAAQVFVSAGYESANMDRIAELAGASKRTVYNHFQSKDDLFRAVIGRFLRQSHELKRITYDPKRSLSSQLNQFADAIVDLTLNPEWLGLVKVMTSLIVVQPDIVAATMASIPTERDRLEAWLEAATTHGRLQVKNPALVARTFWAALSGAFLMPAIYLAPLPPGEANATKKELIAMLIARHSRGGA
jgi:TetR/AcrR family transcriptional regulator, regulator of autoinduction and epiphytic fitness